MTAPEEANDEKFSLFDQEERVMAEATEMIRKLEEVADGVRRLSDAYGQGYREQRRLVRISDRFQLDLHKANQQLAAQAAELKQLNEVLRGEVRLREALAEELRYLATIDGLTGLYTRRHLLELGAHEERRWRRHGGHLSLLMMDLDHFKDINDHYGHAAGDGVLARFAKICRRCLRDTDVIGRMGGEEFLAVLPGSNLLSAVEVAERIRESISAEPVKTIDFEIPVTVCIGVTEMTEADPSLERAVVRADKALYLAKNGGRNQVQQVMEQG